MQLFRLLTTTRVELITSLSINYLRFKKKTNQISGISMLVVCNDALILQGTYSSMKWDFRFYIYFSVYRQERALSGKDDIPQNVDLYIEYKN